MKITTRSEYGLRAMYYLKENYCHKPVPITRMVKALNLNKNYLEQLFRALKRHDLVISFRGKDGGYKLSRNPRNIYIGEIIRALEGSIELSDKCNKSKTCNSIECITKNVFTRIDLAVRDVIDNLTLEDM